MQRAGNKPRPRTVGLDRKCKLCDGDIYFGYRGAVEGVCGRCVDLIRSTKPSRSGASGPGCPDYRPPGAVWPALVGFVLGVAAGGAAMHFFGHHLPF